MCNQMAERANPAIRAAAVASLAAMLGLGGYCGPLKAQELAVTIKDHKFQPMEIHVPAKKRFTIYVTNEDSTPEEFESTSMKVEKIIPGHSKGVVRIGPLDPGRYEFFGDFNQATAQGTMIAE